MSVVESHIYTFNVNNAIYLPTGNNYSTGVFYVPQFVQTPNRCHSIYVSVENAQFPSSWYVINQTNNILSFVFNSITYTLSVPLGNYDAYTLISELNTLLTTNGITAFTFFYNSVDNHIGIQWTPYTYQPTVTIAVLSSTTISVPLGLASSDSIIYKTSPVYEFSNQCNLTGVTQYLVQCNSIPTRNWSSQIGGNILASIQNAASVFGLTLFTNTSNLRYSVPVGISITQLEISIYDQTSQLINFNGIPWILTLRVSYVVDETETDQLHKFVEKINQSQT